MAGGIIYQIAGDGTLTRMTPGQPASESEIQEMIANHPEMVTGSDDSLLLIQRECAIADKTDGGWRWSLDHLFVTRDARPVLVEVKQASNTQLRREVIGQLVEYAANAVVYWTRETIRASFLKTCDDNEEVAAQALRSFLEESDGESGGAEPDLFWNRVEANLRAGELTMVIVADQIPRELVRIVEFLNEQMDATVQAVELRWFVADNGMKTLVPRIIGATERAAGKKQDAASLGPNEYWVELKRKYPDLVRGAPWQNRAQDFFSLRTGRPKIVVGCRFVGDELKVFAYFDYEQAKVAFATIEKHKAEVEAAFGRTLEWDRMEGYKAARIVYTLPNAPMQDRADWDRQHTWLHEHGLSLADAIKPYLSEVEEALSAASSAESTQTVG